MSSLLARRAGYGPRARPGRVQTSSLTAVEDNYSDYFNSFANFAHQWPSDSALKTYRREVPGSIPNRACRPSRSEFSVFFSETRENAG